MKYIKTEESVGHVLCHDLTEIIPGVFKGAAFRKGHVVTEADIPRLLAMGKEHLYVWEKPQGFLHEDEGAAALRDLCCGEGLTAGEPSEGKIELRAELDGLLKIDREKLKNINSIGEIAIASRHGDFPVKKGDKVAGMRVIPLIIDEKKIKKAEEICGCRPIMRILPFVRRSAAVIVTGSEIARGRIEDAFGPVVEGKLKEYGVRVTGKTLTGDDTEAIKSALEAALASGADMIVCTGGMSVDPDDRTPGAIKSWGAEIVSYGAPVLPGAMFLMAYKNGVSVMGLPGCVMYAGRTIFDLILPRVLADDVISKESISEYGEGGLCLGCRECVFPNCGFGK